MFLSSARRSLPGALPLVPPQAHPGRGTAVYIEDLSRNEVSSVGDQEGDRRGHVLRMAHAAPGDEVVSDVGGVVRDVEVTGDLYDAWTNRVDADLAVGELDGELAGKAVDRTLWGRVGRVVGEPREPVDRGYVDDAPASPLHHERNGPAREEEVAFHVQVEDGVVGLFIGVQEVERLRDAGVVDECIQPAQGLGRGVHGLFACADLAQVALHGGSLAAELLYLRDGLFWFGVGVVDGNLGSAAGELDGDALAYAHPRAGDQGLLAREVA